MTKKHPTYGLSATLDDEIIEHLGRIAASWASLDGILVELICRLLRDDPAGEVIYFSLNSFKSRLDVITNLVTEMMEDNNPRKEPLRKMLLRINRLNDTRNELIHSAMVEIEGRTYRKIRRPGRKIPRQEIPVKANDLEQHGKAVTLVAGELISFINPHVGTGIIKFFIENPHLWPDGDEPLPSQETLDAITRGSWSLRPEKPQAPEKEPPPQPQSSEE